MSYVHLKLMTLTITPSYRFADRDMFMRYLGGGIGHHSTMTLSEWGDIEDAEDEQEMPDASYEGMNQAQAPPIDCPLDEVRIEHPNEEEPNEEEYSLDHVVSDELDVPQDELDDYEYTEEPELEEDLEDEETSDRDDDDDLGPEHGEDCEGIDSDVGYDYDD
jgi:hypothetical protein